MLTKHGTGLLDPATAETPALSNKLHLMVHVVRGSYPSDLSGMCDLPVRHSFRKRFRVYDFPLGTQKFRVPMDQHPADRSERWCHCLAPSPIRFTGKPFPTCLVRPFMVELFAAGFLFRSPSKSRSD